MPFPPPLLDALQAEVAALKSLQAEAPVELDVLFPFLTRLLEP
jgi:hypothetical protein